MNFCYIEKLPFHWHWKCVYKMYTDHITFPWSMDGGRIAKTAFFKTFSLTFFSILAGQMIFMQQQHTKLIFSDAFAGV